MPAPPTPRSPPTAAAAAADSHHSRCPQIVYSRIVATDQFDPALKYLVSVFQDEGPFRVLIVDSIMNLFRTEYEARLAAGPPGWKRCPPLPGKPFQRRCVGRCLTPSSALCVIPWISF